MSNHLKIYSKCMVENVLNPSCAKSACYQNFNFITQKKEVSDCIKSILSMIKKNNKQQSEDLKNKITELKKTNTIQNQKISELNNKINKSKDTNLCLKKFSEEYYSSNSDKQTCQSIKYTLNTLKECKDFVFDCSKTYQLKA